LSWPLLDRYLSGECGIEESARIDASMGEESAARAELETLRRELAHASEPTLGEAHESLARLHALRPALREGATSPLSQPTPARRSTVPARGRATSWHRRVWYGGATVAAACVLAVAYAGYGPPRSDAPVAHAGVREYTTNPGQRATITLSDGTRVVLNVASRLRVPVDFGTNTRTLDLDGEAQFTVVHDPVRPFVVRANGVQVRDLATTFVVRAYDRVSATTVAVRDGRVAVQLPNLVASQAVTVNPSEFVTISPDGGARVGRMAEDAEFFGWTGGTLVLRKTPLGSALAQLSRWYGIEFRVTDRRLLERDLSITLPGTLTAVALQDIGDVLGVRVDRGTDVITLTPLR
jgi:transmembrane sensor